MTTAQSSFKGQAISLPSARVDGKTVVATGKWLKTAEVLDAWLIEEHTLADPESFLQSLKKSGLRADLFTFSQRVPDAVPKFRYRMERDNVAVIPITSFSDWWNNRIGTSVRKSIRRAAKFGVEVKIVEFNDDLVAGISRIYNEAAVRQGRHFWHYQKSLESVKQENSTYADKSIHLGAYLSNELIGYARLICAGKLTNFLQFLTLIRTQHTNAANALIAKAVEVCEREGMSHLTYGKFIYNDPDSSLTAFKRHNGFEMVQLPKYYVPLTWKGRVALWLGLHIPYKSRIPKPLYSGLKKLKSAWWSLMAGRKHVERSKVCNQ